MENKHKCVRCDAMYRKQKSKAIYPMKLETGDTVYICSECLIEIKEEDEFLNSLLIDNE